MKTLIVKMNISIVDVTVLESLYIESFFSVAELREHLQRKMYQPNLYRPDDIETFSLAEFVSNCNADDSELSDSWIGYANIKD